MKYNFAISSTGGCFNQLQFYATDHLIFLRMYAFQVICTCIALQHDLMYDLPARTPAPLAHVMLNEEKCQKG